jgi:hypothetical protein
VNSPSPIYQASQTQSGFPSVNDKLEIVISSDSFIKFHLFVIPPESRNLFPGYKIPFVLETDIGLIQTYVSSAKSGTPVGDLKAGRYFQSKLSNWYRAHTYIKVGDKVRITIIEPMKRYRLETVK